ncbi:MAG: ATP-dependent helicase [Phycisphaerales bacterium]
MDGTIEAILADLTEPQREAVCHVDGPLLVLAGPGSGKTRVITRRVAHLVACGIPAWSILAVTFTNKAAGEMRNRIDGMVPADVPGRRGLTVTTFHSFCARMLRRYADRAGIPEAYTIYDSADQRSAIKRALKSANLDSRNFGPAAVHSQISHAKNQMLDAVTFAEQANDFYSKSIARVYTAYTRILSEAGAVDFDDLLLKMATLLRDQDDVRSEMQERYQYLLIDEYQDTNQVQFVLANQLASAHRNICVVGDPDQSIYGWRGADIRNILEFESHYPQARTIALGENFRSTQHIVAVADGLIRHNRRRKHKDLFTNGPEGEKIQVVRCRDEHHEAELVADELLKHHERGIAWKDMAVFYRVNALSRVAEEVLRHRAIPHVIARGTAFYERAEIKDALAYLRLLINPADTVSLVRIINAPARGIGKTTLNHVEIFANQQQITVFEALARAAQVPNLTDRAVRSISRFVALFASWQKRMQGCSSDGLLDLDDAIIDLPDLVSAIVQESSLESFYQKSGLEEDVDRLANIQELVSSAAEFVPPLEFGPDPNLRDMVFAWLESIALVSDADMVDPENGAVTLMTLHAAKGLEFPVVCMIGLEEGLMPHFNASMTDAQIEEERRLCFVGITRAMQHLMLASAGRRTQRGVRERTMASHFLRELPREHIEELDLGSTMWDDGMDEPHLDRNEGVDEPHREIHIDVHDDPESLFAIGSRVRHPQFGIGRIETLERHRNFTRSKIAFAAVGVKTLILEYARLERA